MSILQNTTKYQRFSYCQDCRNVLLSCVFAVTIPVTQNLKHDRGFKRVNEYRLGSIKVVLLHWNVEFCSFTTEHSYLQTSTLLAGDVNLTTEERKHFCQEILNFPGKSGDKCESPCCLLLFIYHRFVCCCSYIIGLLCSVLRVINASCAHFCFNNHLKKHSWLEFFLSDSLFWH